LKGILTTAFPPHSMERGLRGYGGDIANQKGGLEK
jgi:hypothetical protein